MTHLELVEPLPLLPSRCRVRDLLSEAVAGVMARPARAMMTALGTVLGVAALVATLGLAKTAGNQIVGRFDELEATDVQLTPTGGTLPWDADERLLRLNGVRAAGSISPIDVSTEFVTALPIDVVDRAEVYPLPVNAMSPTAFRAVRASLWTGKTFDASTEDSAVAVLGFGAASRLGISRVDQQPAIFIGERTFTVIGILDDVGRRPELLDSIMIPNGVARSAFGLEGVASVQIEAELGAAQLVGRQGRIALSPDDPELVRASVPPRLDAVRGRVGGDVNSLFLLLGGVSLLVGALGIANVTLVSVLERVGEIGLRRAVGAARRHIAAQFLVESTLLGFFGGLLGTALAVVTIVAVAAAKDWVPVLDPWLPMAAPVAGALVGLVSGIYPSWRAASVEPVDALRGGV